MFIYTNIFCLYLYILRMVAKSCTSTVTIRDSYETLGLLGLFHGMPSVHQGCQTTVSAIASHWDVTTGAWVWCRICGDATIFFLVDINYGDFFARKVRLSIKNHGDTIGYNQRIPIEKCFLVRPI